MLEQADKLYIEWRIATALRNLGANMRKGESGEVEVKNIITGNWNSLWAAGADGRTGIVAGQAGQE